MKNLSIIIGLLVTVMTFESCSSPEPKEFLYEVIISNASGEVFTVSLYNNNDIIDEGIVEQNDAFSCTYKAEFFRALRGCSNSVTNSLDSILVVFSNGKGYSCNALIPEAEQTLCFGVLKNPFSEGFNDLGNNRYEFVITEEDFINAHDLPE